MTRQLEQALRRPSAPVNPDRPGESAAVSATAPKTVPAAAPPASGAPAPAPKAPDPDAGQPAGPKAPDPFSVEEIEAEFARLLGRTDKS
jgi:hypothetical protein